MSASVGADTGTLRRQLRRAERMQQLRAYALIAPMLLFMLLTFLVPIGLMLVNAVHDPVVGDALPRTAAALRAHPPSAGGQPPVDDAAYEALATDLREAMANQTASRVASRLNFEESGYRTLLMKTARQLARAEARPDEGWKSAMLGVDPAWGQAAVWATLQRTTSPWTSGFLLNAVDLKHDTSGAIVRMPEERRIHVEVFGRTLWVGFVVTVFCALIAYPLSYWLAHMPTRKANLLMVLVLLPFWTSLLVRTTAWIVLLQKEGVVNALLRQVGLIHEPLDLVFNRFGVVVAMTHILVPFMILPLYSVMRQIPESYVRAARSLGASPAVAFARVYFPQSLPGLSAGVLLVFILSLGYYITPALVGGAGDQMISYFIADNLTRSLNWGLASALGGLLLVGVLLLYAVYERIVGLGNVRLG